MKANRLNMITIAIVLALSAGFGFGVMMPGARKMGALRDAIVAEQAAVRLRQAEVGDVSAVYKQLVTLSEDVSSFRQKLPSDRRMGEFLNGISDAMSQTGIRDFHVQPLPPTRVMSENLPEHLRLANGTGVLPVKIAFESDFQKAFELLDAIEVLPRLAYVERFDVKSMDERSTRLSVTMVVQAFHFNHDQLIGDISAELTSEGDPDRDQNE